MVQLPEGIRDLSLLKNFQTGYGNCATFYSMGTDISLPRDTVADYSPPRGSKAENEHSCTSTPSAFMTCTKYSLFFKGKITTAAKIIRIWWNRYSDNVIFQNQLSHKSMVYMTNNNGRIKRGRL